MSPILTTLNCSDSNGEAGGNSRYIGSMIKIIIGTKRFRGHRRAFSFFLNHRSLTFYRIVNINWLHFTFLHIQLKMLIGLLNNLLFKIYLTTIQHSQYQSPVESHPFFWSHIRLAQAIGEIQAIISAQIYATWFTPTFQSVILWVPRPGKYISSDSVLCRTDWQMTRQLITTKRFNQSPTNADTHKKKWARRESNNVIIGSWINTRLIQHRTHCLDEHPGLALT